MPQVDPAHHHSRRNLASLMVGVGALVVVIGVIVGVWIWMSRPEPTKAETDAVLKNVMRQEFSGQREAAITALKQQLTKAQTDDEKLALYMALGARYENKNDLKQALETYRKAEGVRKTYGTNSAIARMSEANGDKTTALEYYKRNRDLIKSGEDAERGGELDEVEKAIARLEGGQ